MAPRINLGEIAADVVFKDIKNVHLSVYPPTGRVHIAAPARMSLDTIRLYAISKLGWIKQQQKKLRSQARETPREYLNRESHYVWGKRYLLKIQEGNSPAVELRHNRMHLTVRSGTDAEKRQTIVAAWQREQLRKAATPLIAKWEPLLGVKVNRCFVQRMKTKWGSCSPPNGNIRLNTELSQKPRECLEYIVVHEMAHLLVRHHNDKFSALMDRCLPNWRQLRQRLNRAPLSHTDWAY